MVEGPYQMGGVVGTPPSPPPPSVVFTGYRPPDPPPCLSSKGAGHQNVRSHTRMLGPSVFPDSNIQNLTKSEQKHTFSKNGHVPQKIQRCQFLEKSRRRPSGRDSQELVRRYPVCKLTSTKSIHFYRNLNRCCFFQKCA